MSMIPFAHSLQSRQREWKIGVNCLNIFCFDFWELALCVKLWKIHCRTIWEKFSLFLNFRPVGQLCRQRVREWLKDGEGSCVGIPTCPSALPQPVVINHKSIFNYIYRWFSNVFPYNSKINTLQFAYIDPMHISQMLAILMKVSIHIKLYGCSTQFPIYHLQLLNHCLTHHQTNEDLKYFQRCRAWQQWFWARTSSWIPSRRLLTTSQGCRGRFTRI